MPEVRRADRRQAPRFVRTAWVDAVVTGVVAALVWFGIAVGFAANAEQDRAQVLDDDAAVIFRSIENGLGRIESDLLAFKGLFDASEEVSNTELNAFASTTGVLARVAAVALIREVGHDDLAAFEQEMDELIPGFRIFAIIDGTRTDPPEVAVHYVVEMMARRADFPDGIGLDAVSVPAMQPAVEEALTTGSLAATEPYPFALTDEEGIVTILPLDQVPGERPGVLIAAKHVAEVIAEQVPPNLQDHFKVTLAAAAAPASEAPGHRSTVIEFGGRPWTVTAQADPSPPYMAPPWEGPLFYGIALLLTLTSATIAYGRSRHNLLAADLAAAQAMNREKDDFLSSVSHQLRTPLTSVSGFTKQLLDSWDALPDIDRIEFLRIIDSQASEMEWVVQNLLVASRAESGLASVESVPIGLHVLAAEVLASLPEPDARTINLDPGEAWALADRLRARQIVRNLVVNAIEHGGPQIEIRCTMEESEAIIEVRDNGQGVSDAIQDVLFDRYAHTQGNNPLVPLGLGLGVSQTLATLMAGRISYRREEELTIFSVHLPPA